MAVSAVGLQNYPGRILYQRGWSDRKLAERAGLTRIRVNRVKNRKAQPSVGEVLLISRALDVTPETIFFLDHARYRQTAAREEPDEMFDALRSSYESPSAKGRSPETTQTKS